MKFLASNIHIQRNSKEWWSLNRELKYISYECLPFDSVPSQRHVMSHFWFFFQKALKVISVCNYFVRLGYTAPFEIKRRRLLMSVLYRAFVERRKINKVNNFLEACQHKINFFYKAQAEHHIYPTLLITGNVNK